MKSRILTCITAMTLFAALAIPIQLAAQHTRYKLVDIGMLGGPVSYLSAAGQGSLVLNSQGMVAGSADTSGADPFFPVCFNPDCFISHGVLWRHGVLSDLGALSGPNNSSAMSAINARGWTAGFSENGEIDPLTGFPEAHAVLWKRNNIVDLGTLGGFESIATAVKNGGEVVGFSSINAIPDPFSFLGGPIHPFIWKNGVMEDLGTLGGPDALPGAGCVNERNGIVVGGSLTNSTPNPSTGSPTQHAFLWENGTMTDIPTLGGTFAFAQCANNLGQVVGVSNLTGDVGCNGSLNFCNQDAFLWDRGVLTDLGTLGGTFSIPIWLSNTGEAVGAATTPGDQAIHASLWRNGVIRDLGAVNGDDCSFANAINSRSQIVGVSLSCATGDERAFLWEDGGPMVDLNTLIPANSSLRLAQAFNINDKGEIVGLGVRPGDPTQDQQLAFFGHVFLLIPCENEEEACNDSREATTAETRINAVSVAQSPTTSRQLDREIVAAWRARLTRRYHIPGLRRKD